MHPLQTQHTEWLKEQLINSENMLVEAQNIVAEAKRNIAYAKEMLKLASHTPGKKENISGNETDISGNEDDISGNETDTSGNETDIRRTAKQMLLPAYANKPIIDAIHQCLLESRTELVIDDIIQGIFDVETEEEFQRIKPSIWTEMRRGQNKGMWQKVGKGTWSIPQEELPILEAIAKTTAIQDEDAPQQERVLMVVQ